MTDSLNRTSVGLKPVGLSQLTKSEALPQSNQRGIETWHTQTRARGTTPGLNRTSVGLKQPALRTSFLDRHSLNRTSVGLKHDSH